MSETHYLKTWPVYFDAVERGEKTFEIRKDDRGFQRGDLVVLQRYDPGRGCYTGGRIEKRISWILTGGQHGLEPGYVALALSDT